MDPSIERLADEALERDPNAAIRFDTGAEDRRDMVRPKLARELRLTLKARHDVGIVGVLLPEKLDRDVLTAGAHARVDLAHRPAAEKRVHRVLARDDAPEE